MTTRPKPPHEIPHGRIQDPKEFVDSMTKAFDGLHGFIHAAREWTLPEEIDGVTVNSGGGMPYPFQAAWQFTRPGEFHQSLVDMVRMMFEPGPPGTLFLNSNFGMFLEGIPTQPFRLAYISRISEPGESIADFKTRVIDGCCAEFGLDQRGPSPLYGVVCAGQGSILELPRQCSKLFGAGYTLDGLLNFMGAVYDNEGDTTSLNGPECHLGYSIDPALGDRFRVSLWRFVLAQTLQ